jgi:S-adenosyl-L-methionine hydrolase (adenosine-forming)
MIALLTDFGLEDIYVGVMKSVILSIDPAAQIVDLSHCVPPQDVETGAFLLSASWPYLPAGTVVVGVVDPGVGSARRLIGIRIGDGYFVGPDNGLVSLVVADRKSAAVVELDRRRFHLPNRVAETFHGRDIFAPVAAHLNSGVALSELGSPIEPSSLVRIRAAGAAFGQREVVATVRLIDHFGNMILDLTSAAFQVWIGGARFAEIAIQNGWSGQASVAANYASATDGEPALIPDSFGRIEIAMRNGSAAIALGGIDTGAKVSIRRAVR